MAEQRETQNAWVKPVEDDDVKEYRARFASVLDRGITSSRLSLPPGLDSDMHYEFVAMDSMNQADARSLGFQPVKIQTEAGSPESLHNTADGNYVVGDVMLMKIPKKYKAVMDDEVRKRNEAKHGKPGVKQTVQAEERLMQSDFQRTVGLPTIDTPEARSSSTPVNAEQLLSATKTT